MKNKILKYLLLSLFFIQGTTSVCQTDLDQLYLGLRIISPTFNLQYLYIPGHNNFITIRKKSDFKFSFNKTKAWHNLRNSYYIDNSYYNAKWNGNISNFTVGYSPIPHLYVTGNLLVGNEKREIGRYDSDVILGGIGIGGYILKEGMDKKPSKWNMPDKGLLINALVGYNRGKISHVELIRVGSGKFILNQIYGKIGFDYQYRFLGIASNIRFGVINYGKTRMEGHGYEDLSSQRELLTAQNNYLFGELSCRTYVGIKYGQLYINAVITKVNSELRRFILSDMVSVGVVLDIQEIFKKKKNEK